MPAKEIIYEGWYWGRSVAELKPGEWRPVFLKAGAVTSAQTQIVGPIRQPQCGKTREQEEKYHALIADVREKKQAEGVGEGLSLDDWKRLLVAAFRYDTETDPDLMHHWIQFGSTKLLPQLGNRIGSVMVGEQTRRFPRDLASAFIDWLQAFLDGVE